jgi:hypothetical protein
MASKYTQTIKKVWQARKGCSVNGVGQWSPTPRFGDLFVG